MTPPPLYILPNGDLTSCYVEWLATTSRPAIAAHELKRPVWADLKESV